ncbi:heterokaryon incompatibility protein-domain-containing protein [Tricladium varicosporioides]|nr:heterokaryon incompatibility protein-domain-containing protein [Hymenoscyphus varicosporioides]
MTNLQYAPLPLDSTIRLLRLHPGATSDQLNCTLQPVSLHSSPSYEAVSYCWGKASETALITCNNTIIPIQRNLFNLLIVFRNSSSDRLLWVDAVCINQSDGAEKTHQVGMMFQIYQNATRVLSWLGEPDESSWIDNLLITKLMEAREKWRSSTPQQEFNASNYLPPSPNLESAYLATLKLAERPYFSRIWIIQEIAANQNVLLQCGNANISFFHFISALRSIPSYLNSQVRTTFATTVFIAQDTQSVSKSSYGRGTLLEHLVRHRPSQATYGRDKIFALCGLASDIRDGTLKNPINFAAEATVSEVLHELAINMLTSHKNLDILSIGHSWQRTETGYGTTNLELPSWVPNWVLSSRYIENVLDLNINRDLRPQFHASRNTRYTPHVSSDRKRLSVMGYTLDVISARGQKMVSNFAGAIPNEEIGETMFKDWKEIALANRKQEEKYITGTGTLYDAYWQSCICAYLNDLNSRREFQHTERDFRSQPPVLSQRGASFLRSIPLSDYMTMIRTREGYIGQAPAFVETGDHVMLLAGAKVPIVARMREGGWEVLGDCYIHGVMFGEAFEERRCNVLELI